MPQHICCMGQIRGKMYKYLLYGMIVESDVEFMQLMKADDNLDDSLFLEGHLDGESDIKISKGDCHEEVMDFLTRSDALKCRYEIGMEYSAFTNKGGYYVIRDGREIIYEVKEGYTPQTVSSWLLGFAMAMLLLQRRVHAVHCSAVTDKDGTFLISGEPGAGKSSLTRKLLERGYHIMADDVAAVKKKSVTSASDRDNDCEKKHAYVYPAFPYQKLCRNEVESRDFRMDELIYIGEDKDKFFVPVKDKFVVEPKPLKFMIFLRALDVPEVKMEKLSGINQFMAFRTNLFLHRLTGKWESLPEVMSLTMALAGDCPIYMITRPLAGNSQDIIADMVEKIIES